MKNKKVSKSTTSAWLWTAPMKFALVFLGLIMLLCGVYMGVSSLITPNPPQWPVSVIIFAIFVFTLYRLIKCWLPGEKLDRLAFVKIYHGVLLEIILSLILLLVILHAIWPQLIMMMLDASPTTVGIATTGIIAIAVIGAYTSGLVLTNIYAVFTRAVSLNVPRWKAALSIPFSILWLPGYISDDTKQKSDKSASRYTRMTSYILSHRWLTVVAIFICLVLYGFIYQINLVFLAVYILPVLIYIVWQIFNRNTKDVRGWFATLAVAINIALILCAIVFAPRGEQTPTTITAPETIQITDIAPDTPDTDNAQ